MLNRRSLLRWATISAPLTALSTRFTAAVQTVEPPAERVIRYVVSTGQRSFAVPNLADGQVTKVLGKFADEDSHWAELAGDEYTLTGPVDGLVLKLAKNVTEYFQEINVFYR